MLPNKRVTPLGDRPSVPTPLLEAQCPRPLPPPPVPGRDCKGMPFAYFNILFNMTLLVQFAHLPRGGGRRAKKA